MVHVFTITIVLLVSLIGLIESAPRPACFNVSQKQKCRGLGFKVNSADRTNIRDEFRWIQSLSEGAKIGYDLTGDGAYSRYLCLTAIQEWSECNAGSQLMPCKDSCLKMFNRLSEPFRKVQWSIVAGYAPSDEECKDFPESSCYDVEEGILV